MGEAAGIYIHRLSERKNNLLTDCHIGATQRSAAPTCRGRVRLDVIGHHRMSSFRSALSRRGTRLLSLALSAALVAGTAFAFDPPPAPPEIVALVDRGDFKAANAAIDAALAQPNVPADTARALAFERERMRRIGLDFPHDEAKVRADIRKQIPDLRDDEFARWEANNTLEHLTIDGRSATSSAPSAISGAWPPTRSRAAPNRRRPTTARWNRRIRITRRRTTRRSPPARPACCRSASASRSR